MTHANAPWNIEGRRRLVERCRTRPIADVGAEAGVSRACLSKWKNRYDTHGEAGLQDRLIEDSTDPDRSSGIETPVDHCERSRRRQVGSHRRQLRQRVGQTGSPELCRGER
nr:leucine zipper domain-containing protein [Streptomyces seoulensis]